MKRFIALVLSLVMALSLCAPAWGMMPVGGDAENTVKPALPVAKMTPLGSDYEIDTTGSKMGVDFGVFALDTAYQFEPTESVEEAQASYYRYWHADFVVYSDKDVPDGSMALAGYYDAWCSLNNYKWVALTNEGLPIGANEEVRLVYGMGNGGISVNYEELCNYGNDGTGFQCGVADITGENVGSTITVELRLYETEEPSDANGNSHNVETGNYEIIGTYSYTFGPVAMIGDAEYDTLQDAVDAAENGDVITVKANNLSATVNTSKFFTVEYAADVTKVATITAAEGYAVSENNGTYTVKKLCNVTFNANGGSGELTIAPMVESKFTLPKCTFTAPEGKVFKAWRVSGVEYAEGDEIDVTADVTVTAVWKDVEKCTGDSHLKVVVEYSGEKATKVYCDSCGMTFAFVQGTEDDAKNEFGAGNYKNAEKDVWYSLKTQSGEAPVVPPVEDEPVEIPVSGEDGEGIVVEAIISGTTATIEKMDELDKVIGEDADTGTVTINLSGVKGTVEDAESGESTEVPIDTVEIPTEVVKNIADAVASSNNDAESLEIILGGGVSIEFDADALANKVKKAEGEKITISVKLATDESAELNDAQKETVGESKAFDISVTSDNNNLFSKDSKDKGTITLGVPYALGENEKAEGVVVYYVDEDGNREECDTVYDEATCRVTWVTNHLSIYMIGYEEPSVPGDGNNGGITRPSITTPSTDKTVKSADTFDAGIALYVGMSIVAAAGSAVVIGKKKEF